MKTKSKIREEFSIRTPIFLFNIILQYVDLGKIIFSSENEYNVIEFIPI